MKTQLIPVGKLCNPRPSPQAQTRIGVLISLGLVLTMGTGQAQIFNTIESFEAPARTSVIDFETIHGMPNAIETVPAESRLSNQFLSTLGVIFSSGSPYVAVVDLGYGHATSGVNGIGGTTTDGTLTYSAAVPIVATFFDPSNPTMPAVTDFVSLRIDLVPTSGLDVTLNAYDLEGKLIASVTTFDSSGALLELSADGIHSVKFIGTSDSTGAAVDDFTFNLPVSSVEYLEALVRSYSLPKGIEISLLSN
jgi:hypothetical protein